MPEDDLPKPPRIRPWTEVVASLKAEYPEEFTGKSLTIEDQLRDASINLRAEERHLDSIDPPFDSSDDIEDKMKRDYQDYRDNKRWLRE